MARILLVDDEPSVLNPLSRFLTKIEHEVVGMATSGEESIALARKLTPDLVLMDIRMPGKIDGIDAAGIIKENLKIPSIFITGHIRGDYVDRARRLDPLGFILKPFKMSEVQAAIDIALNKAQRASLSSAEEG